MASAVRTYGHLFGLLGDPPEAGNDTPPRVPSPRRLPSPDPPKARSPTPQRSPSPVVTVTPPRSPPPSPDPPKARSPIPERSPSPPEQPREEEEEEIPFPQERRSLKGARNYPEIFKDKTSSQPNDDRTGEEEEQEEDNFAALDVSRPYAFVLSIWWSLAIVLYSIFAAVIYFDVLMLTKKEGRAASYTRWMVLYGSIFALFLGCFIISTMDTRRAIDDLDKDYLSFMNKTNGLLAIDEEDIIDSLGEYWTKAQLLNIIEYVMKQCEKSYSREELVGLVEDHLRNSGRICGSPDQVDNLPSDQEKVASFLARFFLEISLKTLIDEDRFATERVEEITEQLYENVRMELEKNATLIHQLVEKKIKAVLAVGTSAESISRAEGNSEISNIMESRNVQVDIIQNSFENFVAQETELLSVAEKLLSELRHIRERRNQLEFTQNSLEREITDLEEKLTAPNLVSTRSELESQITKLVLEYLPKQPSIQKTTEKDLEESFSRLLDIFAADRTGMVDYALASVGGDLLHTKSVIPDVEETQVLFTDNETLIDEVLPQRYRDQFPRLRPRDPPPSFFSRFWSQFDDDTQEKDKRFKRGSDPFWVISSSMHPGDCWAFPGDKANVTLRLAQPVEVTHVTVDHALPKFGRDRNSAPNHIKVHAWDVSEDGSQLISPELIAEFSYSREKQTQTEKLPRASKQTQYITFEILSNHNSYWTCLYRLRVHSEHSIFGKTQEI